MLLFLAKNRFHSEKICGIGDQVFEIMIETLERGEKIKIHGFGNFIVREKRARRGRNPKTGEVMQIFARRVVTFKPSHILRKAMAEASHD